MSDQERLAVEALIQSGPDLSGGTVDEVRAAYEGMGQITPVSPRVTVTACVVGGVPGERIRPDNATGQHTILFFHGGGYMIGSLATHRGLASLLAVAAGATVLSVDYRLAPEHPYPAATDDGLAVYRALLASDLPPASLALAGDSAGGGLALATLMRARAAGLPMPACAFLMSPFVDLAGTGQSVTEKADVDVIVRPGMIEGMGGTYLNGVPATDPLASPLYGDVSGLPPLLVHVGTHEAILDDSLRLVRKVAIADGNVSLKVWSRQPHVWQLFAGMLSEGRQSLEEAGQFISGHLRGPAR